MNEPSVTDLVECARRELALRERVYPRWIDQGKLDARKADHEIRCMRAIFERLDRIREEEEGQPLLF